MGNRVDLFLPLASGTNVAGDLVFLVIAAVVGGFLANALRLPLVLGYIAGGVVVGPFVADVVPEVEDVEFIGELGVALLLFAIGLEFPLASFRRLGRRLVIAAVVQISILGAGGFVIARALGFDPAPATLVAGVAAFSSTALLVRILARSGERNSPAARWALGIALIQDLAAVPLLVVLPQIGSSGSELLADVGIAIAKGVGLVVAVLVAGRWIVPVLLGLVVRTRSRELFLMGTFAIASGVALGSFAVGLSVAFGAFLAGLATAQSPFAARALNELIPLRDLFAATFFVSIGVLLDINVVREEWALVTALLVWGGLGKVLLIFGLARWAGYDSSRALRTGLWLGQVGEFSFLLAKAASGTPADETAVAMVAVGAASMAFSAALIRLQGPLEAGLLRIPAIARRWVPEPVAALDPEIRRYAVIAGYGRTGREIARALDARGFRYVVIDLDPDLPAELAERGIPYVWGDLAVPETVEAAGLEHAHVLALTIPDVVVAAAVVARVHEAFPRLDIVARADDPPARARLRQAGASEVVSRDLETGLEMTQHTLHRFGVSHAEIRIQQQQRRQEADA